MDVRFREASLKTADNLKTIAQTDLLRDLSRLSLPEIDAAVDLVSQLIPAGNVPGVILSGLARVSGNRLPANTIRRDIDLLFQSVEQMLDQAVYTAVFAGPAAVIWGYQNLLKLVGKNPEASFPDGTWQFYVEYALREDTARHSNETHGFDTLLNRHNIRLNAVDRATAWAMAAVHALHQFNDLLANEWRERASLALLREATADLPDAARFASLYRKWETQRPYGRGQDAPASQTYAAYRKAKFDGFLAAELQSLPAAARQKWEAKVRAAEAEDLPAYQQQMTILACLEPGAYGETRLPVPLQACHIGIIYQSRYYFIPVCAPGSARPVDVADVRAQIARLMAAPAETPPAALSELTLVKRACLPELRGKLTAALRDELVLFRHAPILLNCDPRPRALALSELRQTERGVGDHALTIFDSGETFIFDQSHIFFDGAWGASLAEILTSEALSWAVYLKSLPPAQPAAKKLYTAPGLRFQPSDRDLLTGAPRITAEIGVESDKINLGALLNLRKFFKQRNDTLQLTVNDLLVLYRAIHAITYRPAPALVEALKELAGNPQARAAAQAALDEIGDEKRVSPAVLIPIDASQHTPRERLYPMSFEVPLNELDFLQLHAQTLGALAAYEAGGGDVLANFEAFDKLQRTYLGTIAGFGAVMSRAKEIAVLGESASVGSIKLLAHLSTPLQRLLDDIPGRFDMLNDMIKGREVFSNVGAVAKTSTLTRFITAKDDNDKKTLAWGVITDAQGVMRVTLRDFRPHVALLNAAGQHEMAQRLAQDYLSSYVQGLNQYILELRRMTVTRRPPGVARQELHT